MSDYLLPAGYKQTEIGVIPEDWDVKKVSEISSVKGGKRLPKGSLLIDTPNPYPYIRVADMYDGGINISDIKYAPEEVAPTIKNYRIYSTDIFISVAGTLGIIGKIPKELNGANLTENANRITDISCDKDFLLYTLMLERIQNEIDSQKTIGAQPKLALGRIENFKLAIPNSCIEQRSLSQALSDVDALVAALDKLIAKTRDLKTATMQQLLTGKKRLPGFDEGQGYKESVIGLIPEDWEVKQISEIADIDPENLTGNTHAEYEFSYISLEDVERGVLKGYSHQVFRTAPSRARRILRDGDILLSTVRPNLKSHLLFRKQGHNWVCSTGFSVLRCKKGLSIPGLIFSHLFSGNIDGQIETLIAGSNYPAINSSDVQKLKISVSAVEEQRAIALVLSDMDKVISALESRLAKTKAIKQGMMQELLTGKIRLKIEK